MACGKKTFLNRHDAKTYLKLMNKTHSGTTKLTNVYYCSECDHWHMTSMPKISSRDYTRHLNKER